MPERSLAEEHRHRLKTSMGSPGSAFQVSINTITRCINLTP